MVDGGVCDAIPIRHAIDDGFRKNVIILTRNKGYRKEEKDFWLHMMQMCFYQVQMQ
jgi:predicted patatin/cPLA2 family phospholipase